MSVIVAATDGTALCNPLGPAGWAWYVSETCWAAGGFRQASNQVAELFAVLACLRSVPREYRLRIAVIPGSWSTPSPSGCRPGSVEAG